MENQILEVKDMQYLPKMVFTRRIKEVYFFEMPMPFKKIQNLIDHLNNDINYHGLLWNDSNSKFFQIINKDRLEKYVSSVNEEILWEYDYGYLKGKNWELYYDFKGEILLIGITSNGKESFEKTIKEDEVLLRYNYALHDLIKYFESIATAAGRLPLEEEFKNYLNMLKSNYSNVARAAY